MLKCESQRLCFTKRAETNDCELHNSIYMNF